MIEYIKKSRVKKLRKQIRKEKPEKFATRRKRRSVKQFPDEVKRSIV